MSQPQLCVMEGGAPLCSRCRRQPARPHYAAGWYKMCDPCQRRTRSKPRYPSRNCRTCRQPMPANPAERGYCSTRCKSIRNREWNRHVKGEVVAALGGHCQCALVDCGSGHGSAGCAVDAMPLLCVEHSNNDGGHVRGVKKDGTRQGYRAGGGYLWVRYRRALAMPNHGMVLLCSNCNAQVEYNKREAGRAVQTKWSM